MGSKRKKDRSNRRQPGTEPQPTTSEPERAAAEVPPGGGARIPWTPVLALALLGLGLGFREISSPDLGFHLATARWILENGWVPSTDPFTYTVADHAYIDLQWLWQLSLHTVHGLAGPTGIVLLATLSTLAFAGLLGARIVRRNGALGSAGLLLLFLFLLGTQWEPRPHLFSWILGSLVLWILEENARGNRRFLPWLPAVMALWVNTHSLFVLGLVAIGAHLVGHLVQRAFANSGGGPPVALDRRLVGWGLAAGAACVLNPYHVQGLLFPLTQLADLQGDSAYKSTTTGIAEFRSPLRFDDYTVQGHFVLFQALLWRQLLLLLALVGCWWGRARLRAADWLLVAGFTYVFWTANKNFGYFVMAVVPVAAGGLGALGDRLRRTSSDVGARRGTGVGIAIASAVVLALQLTGRWTDLAWAGTRPGSSFNASFLPVEEAAFLVEHEVEGKLLNTWDDGGFLAWRTGLPVAIYSHGEVMGQEFYARYVEAKRPSGFERALASWEPTVAVVPFDAADYWLAYLTQQPDWRLVFANARAAVLLHESIAGDVPRWREPVPGVDYPVFAPEELEARVRAVAARPAAGLATWLRGASAFPRADVARAGFLLQTQRFEAALGVALASLEEHEHAIPDLLLCLGYALEALRRPELADASWNGFLAHEDDPALVRGIRETRARRP